MAPAGSVSGGTTNPQVILESRYPLAKALVVSRHRGRDRITLLKDQGEQQYNKADEQGEQQNVNNNYPNCPWKASPIQPAYDWPDTFIQWRKQRKRLVKLLKKEETKAKKRRRAPWRAKRPLIRLVWLIECHSDPRLSINWGMR
jgi:hypothetical protein